MIHKSSCDRAAYDKPVLAKHENLKDITFEQYNWQCSCMGGNGGGGMGGRRR